MNMRTRKTEHVTSMPRAARHPAEGILSILD